MLKLNIKEYRNFKLTIILFIITIFLLLCGSNTYAVSNTEKVMAKKQYKLFKKKVGFVKKDPHFQKIVNELIKKSKDDTNLNFKVHILDTKVMNALYIGNGHIMIFNGLLKHMKTDNQLAAVLAHEMGHGVSNHIQEQINLTQGLQLFNLIIDEINNDNTGENEYIENLTMTLLEKGFSRRQEKEADQYAVHLLKRSNFDLQGMIDLFNILKKENGGSSNIKLLELFMSHPHLDTRINYTSNLIKKIHRAEKVYNSPVSTAQIVAENLYKSQIEALYSTFCESFKENVDLTKFKEKKQLKKVIERIRNLKSKYNLNYTVESRNKQEGTARVAISFFRDNINTKNNLTIFALDLKEDKFGWKVIKIPQIY